MVVRRSSPRPRQQSPIDKRPNLGGGKKVGGAQVQQQQKIDGPGPTPKAPGTPADGFGQLPATKTGQAPVKTGSVSKGSSVFGVRLSGGADIRPTFGTAQFERLLDRTTGSAARTGNTTAMLFDGVNSFEERNKIISEAKESVHLQTFIFTDDETGWELARLLASKAEEGLDVRVIYDKLGSNRSDEKIFDFMREAGVEVRGYGDMLTQFWDINDRWHEKHLIVDGQISIEGGMNIADEYAFGGSGRQLLPGGGRKSTEAWRDADMRIEGPAVHDAQRGFMKNWAELGEPIPEGAQGLFSDAQEVEGGPTVRFVQHRPDEDGDDHTMQLYIHSINAAQSSIVIENAYFLPPPEIRQALVEAAERGVDVQIMTNSRASNDLGFVSDAARYFFDELLEAGCKIYEKQGGTIHSKTASFDGKYSLVGSHNLNGRSDSRDSESIMATNDPGIAQSLDQRFASGIAECEQITEKTLAQEGFFTNLKQWALSTMAWTF